MSERRTASSPSERPICGRRLVPWIRGALACAVALVVTLAPATAAESGPAWASLTVAQQQALGPLKRDWATIDAGRKQKWLEVAARFPSMAPEERARVQERMGAWAALSPAERARARVQFQEARQLSPEDRQALWQAYQALPEDERQRLVQSAKPSSKRATGNGAGNGTAGNGAKPVEASIAGAATPPAKSNAKSNVVTLPAALRPGPVAPTVVQARPGASTTSIVTPATPPAHHQAGLPKIVATPGFVDPATLLPQRGPQGAAVQPLAATPERQRQP